MVGIICVVSRFRQIIFAISEDLASAANVKIMSAFKFTSIEQVTNPNKIVTQDHSRFSQKAILDASSNSANKCTLKFSWTPFRKTLQNVQDCPTERQENTIYDIFRRFYPLAILPNFRTVSCGQIFIKFSHANKREVIS